MGAAPLAASTQVVTVTLEGEFDLATEIDVPCGARVVVDASGVTFAGSPFLTWLVQTKRASKGMVLARPSEAVRRLLDISGLYDEFTLQP